MREPSIVIPKNIEFVVWAAQIRMDLPSFDIPVIKEIEGWREWASQIIANNALAAVPVPTTLAYPDNKDWQIWASYFVNSVYN